MSVQINADVHNLVEMFDRAGENKRISDLIDIVDRSGSTLPSRDGR